jgi:hypothetical protein
MSRTGNFPDRLRRHAKSNNVIRNIRIHKAERPDNGISPNRHSRHPGISAFTKLSAPIIRLRE